MAARFKHTAEYFRIRAQELKQKTTAAWLAIFDRTDVPAMPFQTLDDLMKDPHLADIGFFQRIDHPTEGKIWNMMLPNTISGGARCDFRPAPKIGQHSVEILREIGYREADIEVMVANGTTVDGRITKREA